MGMLRRGRVVGLLAGALAMTASVALAAPQAEAATNYVRISGAGSTWASNAIDSWRADVKFFGMTVDYQASGASDGRNQFANGTVDFGVSEVPYGITDNGIPESPPTRAYTYVPLVGTGLSFMYNLKVGGKQLRDLRLSGAALAGIFTGKITVWNDYRIAADNPGLKLPAKRITPVVRSDGSGTTYSFTQWLAARHPAAWNAYCAAAGRETPCVTPNFPVFPGSGFTAQNGSLGVSGYTAQDSSDGAITYVEYSYPLNQNFPVAKVLNDAGYYRLPDANSAAIGLLSASANPDGTLATPVRSTDPRAYPIAHLAYAVVPTKVEGSFTLDKGLALGAFLNYTSCEGQMSAPKLGYAPLPVNVVKAASAHVRRIPGAGADVIDVATCNNPTIGPGGVDRLLKKVPQPPTCDRLGATLCGYPATQPNTGTCRPVHTCPPGPPWLRNLLRRP